MELKRLRALFRKLKQAFLRKPIRTFLREPIFGIAFVIFCHIFLICFVPPLSFTHSDMIYLYPLT